MGLVDSGAGSPDADPAGASLTARSRPGWAPAVGAACLPAAAAYLAAVVLLATLSAAAGASSSAPGIARAAAVGWLAAHHIPVIIGGSPLGVLPLLPTLLLGALIARGAAVVASRAGLHHPADAGWMIAMIAATHGVLGTVLAMVAVPDGVFVDPGQAAVGCALVAGTAAAVGLARPCGLVTTALRAAPDWARAGVRAGVWGAAVLLTSGFAAVLVALVVSGPEVIQLAGSDPGGVFGLVILTVGYLPNAAIAAVCWLIGPGLSIGKVQFDPFSGGQGPVPAVPLLAALPQGPSQPWSLVALAVPILIGAGVARRCAHAQTAGVDDDGTGSVEDWLARLRPVTVAAAVLALSTALLGALAGGRLGSGAFDPVSVPVGLCLAAVLGETWVGGWITTLVVRTPGKPSQTAFCPQNAVGESLETAFCPQNALGENALGENALGENALGENALGGPVSESPEIGTLSATDERGNRRAGPYTRAHGGAATGNCGDGQRR